MARFGFVALGALLVLAAGTLQAVAQHDGILGVTPLGAFPAPGEKPEAVRTRIVVDGTTATTQAFMANLKSLGFLNNLESGGSDAYVTAHFDRPGAATIILLRVSEPAPSIGDVLVVEGPAATFLAPPGNGSGATLLWLDAHELGQPLLFKNA